MRSAIISILIMGNCILYAQKRIVKTIEDPNVRFVLIDTKNCFSVAITTAETPRINVEASMDGEYLQNLLLNVEQEGTTTLISAGSPPNFVFPNDKLSAHKVVSISLKISIPKYLNVLVYGSSSNVNLSGAYSNLKVSLFDGKCTLNGTGENVSISTHSGNIEVVTTNAQIIASTKYGNVEQQVMSLGDNHFILNSVTGNIGIRKTE